ncbi:aminodeoxychorismate lyase [Pseudohongiella sp.]|uniref:aminodeoxychorismate lyase n=1 Tax=marine sediment metagenome TaxID=412755 RepID=A0A0F9Z0B1_9ZZZZ|nr:aminodeoxychorismate lyase [Pseudohongiella sp.]HDZ09751.1 aminodeoxychorismate lyase [Pseudohongiella sp.]HEA61635.1 aminodeoxychorismate lyase [Pseudohongiella sp.]
MVAVTLVDGVLADTIPVSDRGLLYGDGVFETICYRRQQLLQLPAHLRRLQQSCERLGIPLQLATIEQHLNFLFSCLPSGPEAPVEGVVKIIVTRGDGGRGYAPPTSAVSRSLIQFHPMPAQYAEFARQGIACMLCQHRVSVNPGLGGLKHLNRLDQVMGSRELVAAQNRPHVDPMLQEGLMFDNQRNLIEGTRSNVFAVIRDQLCTPDVTAAGVCGIMRQTLLAWCAGQGIGVVVRTIPADELMLASEVFICNSVLGIWPVNRLYDFTSDATRVLTDDAMARRAQRGLACQ